MKQPVEKEMHKVFFGDCGKETLTQVADLCSKYLSFKTQAAIDGESFRKVVKS